MDNKEQKEHFLKIGELVDKAGAEFSQYLQNPSDSSKLATIEQLETEGDSAQDKLNAYFTTQRNIPYLSLDRAGLLRKLDEILDQILLSAKTLDAFGSALPPSFTDEVGQLALHLDHMTGTLNKAITALYEDFAAATELTNEIEADRDKSTKILFELEKMAFNSDDEVQGWKGFTAVSRIARRIASVINATKSASEVIEIMSMKYL